MDSQRLTLLNRIKDSDVYFSFIKSPTAIVSTVILVIIFTTCIRIKISLISSYLVMRKDDFTPQITSLIILVSGFLHFNLIEPV